MARRTKLVELEHCAFPVPSQFMDNVGRVVIGNELDIPMAITVQASFFSGTHGEYKLRHLVSEDFVRWVKSSVIPRDNRL